MGKQVDSTGMPKVGTNVATKTTVNIKGTSVGANSAKATALEYAKTVASKPIVSKGVPVIDCSTGTWSSSKKNQPKKVTTSKPSASSNSGTGAGVAAPQVASTPPVTTVPKPSLIEAGAFKIPDQPMYIYRPDTGETYLFDGVVKASHQMSLKIEEEPTKHQEIYVNNARNEPNKVTFDIIMSDVYTSRDALTKRTKNRSESALVVLNELKRDRVLLHVITNLMTYTDMLLSGISLTQDDGTTHFGFWGQLVFTEKPEVFADSGGGGETTQKTKSKTSSTASARTSANLYILNGNKPIC